MIIQIPWDGHFYESYSLGFIEIRKIPREIKYSDGYITWTEKNPCAKFGISFTHDNIK